LLPTPFDACGEDPKNPALRQQLAVLQRRVTRPKLRRSDRLFWVLRSRRWAGWRSALAIVKPETTPRRSMELRPRGSARHARLSAGGRVRGV